MRLGVASAHTTERPFALVDADEVLPTDFLSRLVSEDLAFALRVRANGWRGLFAEDVVCFENCPADMRAFRTRHMKRTRSTCEFLYCMGGELLFSKRIPWVEKLDVLFPALGLPLSLCFVISMARRPRQLLMFLSRSVAVYGALGPLSSVGVARFAITRQAVFHVTAERVRVGLPAGTLAPGLAPVGGLGAALRQFLRRSHPDHPLVQGFEIAAGLFFVCVAVVMAQVSFLGLALAYILHPVMHHVPWRQPWLLLVIHVPALLMIGGLGLSSLSLIGMQPVFLNFDVHF